MRKTFSTCEVWRAWKQNVNTAFLNCLPTFGGLAIMRRNTQRPFVDGGGPTVTGIALLPIAVVVSFGAEGHGCKVNETPIPDFIT